ncbi:MAG: 50S ribosomal protein L15 [Fibrobacteres bacterium]|nr:50S ribosomal protein L15 [Fibrobacterota bacterium]
MVLASLKPAKGSNKKSKKIGRGNGNGHGRTSCRGSNGANSRSGSKHYASFEGGQMPLQRRLPKRGFTNFFEKSFAPVNLGEVDKRLNGAKTVDAAFLVKIGLLDSVATPFKILGNGNISSAVSFKVKVMSKSAKEKIVQAGGTVEE